MKMQHEGLEFEIDETKEPNYKEGYVKPYSDLTYRAKGFKNIISAIFKDRIKAALEEQNYDKANELMKDYIKRLKPLVAKTKAEPNAKAFHILQTEFKNMLDIFGYYTEHVDEERKALTP